MDLEPRLSRPLELDMTFATLLTIALATGGMPASDPGDASPRGAARTYLFALLQGDADAALSMVAPCSDDARKAVAGSAAIYGALHRLNRSVDIALASGGRADASNKLALQLQRVDTAWLVVNGDRAVLRFAVGEPVVLRRTGAGWRVWVKEREPGMPSGDELLRLGKSFSEAASEVASGLQGGAISQLLEGATRASKLAVDRQIVAL
jgi:hypothetical protein